MTSRAFIVYTALRLLVLAVVWGVLQLTTPLRGLLAIAVALLISGLVSLFVLDRQRERLSIGVAGFFGRLNARIDASSRAEDEWDDERRATASSASSASSASPAAPAAPAPSQGEQTAEQQAVHEDQQSGALEHPDERGPDRS